MQLNDLPVTTASSIESLFKMLMAGRFDGAEVRSYLSSRVQCQRPLSPRSLSQALSAIRSFHRWLDRRMGMPNAAMSLVRGPKTGG